MTDKIEQAQTPSTNWENPPPENWNPLPAVSNPIFQAMLEQVKEQTLLESSRQVLGGIALGISSNSISKAETRLRKAYTK